MFAKSPEDFGEKEECIMKIDTRFNVRIDVRPVNHNGEAARPILHSCALPGPALVKGLAPPGA